MCAFFAILPGTRPEIDDDLQSNSGEVFYNMPRRLATSIQIIAAAVCIAARVVPLVVPDNQLPPLNVTIKDITPKFLTFYEAANKKLLAP
jgi:hypothetical protein